MKYLVIIGCLFLGACAKNYKVTACGDVSCITIHTTNSLYECTDLANTLHQKYSFVYICGDN